MVFFILHDENPLGVKITASCIQNLPTPTRVKIISLSPNEFSTFHTYLTTEDSYFWVVNAGETIHPSLFEDVLDTMQTLKESDAGFVHRKNGQMQLVVKAEVVQSISPTVFKYAPFKEYFFQYFYFYLSLQWIWHPMDTGLFLTQQGINPRWKNQKKEWELMYPLLSSRITAPIMNACPSVSIIICTYNNKQLLPSAIFSVLKQYRADWELIVVDDGSTDDTQEVLDFFAKDVRVVLLRNKRNLGKAKSLNKALMKARGKWLLELDADDWLAPDCIEHLLQAAEEERDEFNLIYGDHFEWVDRPSTSMFYRGIRKAPDAIDKDILLHYPGAVAPRMCRADVLKEIKGWCTEDPYNGRMYEDIVLLAKLMDKSYRVPHTLYHRRLRRDSITQTDKHKFHTWKRWFKGMLKSLS